MVLPLFLMEGVFASPEVLHVSHIRVLLPQHHIATYEFHRICFPLPEHSGSENGSTFDQGFPTFGKELKVLPAEEHNQQNRMNQTDSAMQLKLSLSTTYSATRK